MRKTPRVTEYAQALELLYGRIDYEKIGHAPYTTNHYRLDRMRQLLELIGNPHRKYAIVHVAGTKGKGTTATLLADALVACGLRTGLATSPHLLRLEERMRFQGVPCAEEQLVELADAVLSATGALEAQGLGRPTFFELTIAMGMLHAAQQGADCLVLEVGLGGRLDSTNVCSPVVSVITSISLDHQAQLGDTIAAIAGEKAGIIKLATPVVCSARHPDARRVIIDQAAAQQAPLVLIDRDFEVAWKPSSASAPADGQTNPALNAAQVGIASSSAASISYRRLPGVQQGDAVLRSEPQVIGTQMLGRHQADNFGAALATLEVLRELGWSLPVAQVEAAWLRSMVPARLQICGDQPIRIIDTAHNPASIVAAMGAIDDHFPTLPRTVVFGSSKDKDYRSMLREILPGCQRLILTSYQLNPRALPHGELFDVAREIRALLAASVADRSNPLAELHVAATPAEAWSLAQRITGPSELVLATGSFFLAAELLPIVRP